MSDYRYDADDCQQVKENGQQVGERTRDKMVDQLVDCLYARDTDISAIDRCLKELEQAGRACEELDVERSLEEFHKRFEAAFEDRTEVVKTSGKRHTLVRMTIIAAAVCVFAVTAQASEWDVVGAIARWADGQFTFSSEGEQKVHVPEAEAVEYASLQEALNWYHVRESLSPTKFPEGAEFSQVLVKNEGNCLAFFAEYELRGEKLYVSVRNTEKSPHTVGEIDDHEIEMYKVGEIRHYLMSNLRQKKVSWCNGHWECSIAGYLSRDELIMMIDSIYRA